MNIEIIEKVIIEGLLIVTVVIDDTTYTFSTRNPTGKWLETQIKEEKRRLKAVKVTEKDIKIGVFTFPSPSQPPTLTPDEVKKEEYIKKYGLLQTRKNQLDLGLISQIKYDLLRDEVKVLGKDIGEF